MVSVRRVAPILLVAIAIAIPAGAAKKRASSSHPPRELHRVGDHWTPYTPPDPATYPPTAKTYTIKRGDTLWALAQQLYGNAYMWPQLWEANTWITDAHWIYPGDMLLVEGETAAQAAAGTSGTSSATGGSTAGSTTTATLGSTSTAESTMVAAPEETQAAPVSSPIPLGTEADVYCYGYIGDPNEPMPNYVASFEDVEAKFGRGEVVQNVGVGTNELLYIDGGSSTGIVPGETYIVVEPGEMVQHPRTQKPIGRLYSYRGQIRILCADDKHARGLVTQACDDIRIGYRLKPMPQIPIPLARIPALPTICDGPSGKATGYIITAQGFESILGQGMLVQVNLGRDDQLQPGDFLNVYRESPIAGQPRIMLGQIAILTTESHTSTARVTQMRYAMTIGDHVEAR
jgi:hypothetical protein